MIYPVHLPAFGTFDFWSEKNRPTKATKHKKYKIKIKDEFSLKIRQSKKLKNNIKKNEIIKK
ncbi:MAG: hypothetical protein AUJ24_01730 [Parcubacteria group bacterium CG1_02_36_42]|nr:MAG: hypothetical protein AUJ24_01730 [Parcubacteria group bacterium CG1_02_36_42]